MSYVVRNFFHVIHLGHQPIHPDKPEHLQLESEFVGADLMIRLLDGAVDSYSVKSVENRINALLKAQTALLTAQRLQLPGKALLWFKRYE